MKTIYVLTSQYMPLIPYEDPVNLSERAKKNGKMYHTQDITVELITQTLDKSKPLMLAFESKKAAVDAMKIGLKDSQICPYYIDGKIPYFAVPLIFTVQVNDDFSFEGSIKLTGEILYNYLETENIPFVHKYSDFFKGSIIGCMDGLIEALGSRPMVVTINKADVTAGKVAVFYLAANPCREAVVNLSKAKQDLEKIKEKEAAPEDSSTSCSMM